MVQKARESFHGGPDYFGEEHLFSRFQAWLESENWEKGEAAALAASLGMANYKKAVPVIAFGGNWALNQSPGEDNEDEKDLEKELREASVCEPLPPQHLGALWYQLLGEGVTANCTTWAVAA